MNLAVLGVVLWFGVWANVGLECIKSECSDGLVWREGGSDCTTRAAIT